MVVAAKVFFFHPLFPENVVSEYENRRHVYPNSPT